MQNSYADCLPYYLYGYNEKFVHFPKNTTYCVENNDGKISIVTDKFGGRIVTQTKTDSHVLRLFGESQLFGFDVSGRPGSHDLNQIYPKKKLIFYGAPNNGPFESIQYIKYVLKQVKMNRVVFGFNFCTDIFRSMPEWDPRKFVLLESKDLQFYQNFPFLYEAKIALSIFGGEFFTTKRPNNIKLRKLYDKLDNKMLKERINTIFYEVEKMAKKNNIIVDLIVYPPYWGYEVDAIGKIKRIKAVMVSFKEFICNDLKIFTFLNKILVGKPYGSVRQLFSADKRHFARGKLKYISNKNYCPK